MIATISGYTGQDRSNLIKPIYKTGGAYTGSLSTTNTHVVCFFLNLKGLYNLFSQLSSGVMWVVWLLMFYSSY